MTDTRQTAEIGIISDTHGLIRPEALAALEGCELIIHAGDVGDAAVLEALGRVAPVRAVRGNVDVERPVRDLPETTVVEIHGAGILVLHNLDDLDRNPMPAGIDVIVYGHTHEPKTERKGGVLYLNPGSAGPRRFRLPVMLARLKVGVGLPEARLIKIQA